MLHIIRVRTKAGLIIWPIFELVVRSWNQQISAISPREKSTSNTTKPASGRNTVIKFEIYTKQNYSHPHNSLSSVSEKSKGLNPTQKEDNLKSVMNTLSLIVRSSVVYVLL